MSRRLLSKRGFCAGALASGATAFEKPRHAFAQYLANDNKLKPYLQKEYSDPKTLSSKNRLLATTLKVGRVRSFIGADAVELRCYNDDLVGPTLRVRPGDTLRIRVENHLAWEHAAAGHIGHDYNSTNLHTHGLHISPRSPSDNVLITIRPLGAPSTTDPLVANGVFDYEFQIPEDHLPGTHWYHSHLHGSTAVQLASGMAGALIVLGDIDEVPEIKAALERVFVFQQIPYDAAGVIEDQRLEDLVDRFEGAEDGRIRFTTINGTVPVIRMRRGHLERWRLVHGGIFELLSIAAIGCDKAFDPEATSIQQFCTDARTAPISDGMSFYPIARDGITLGAREAFKGRALPRLGPGNRMDVLVTAHREGTYILRKESEASTELTLNAQAKITRRLNRGYAPSDAIAAVREDPYALAVIVVEPGGGDTPLPSEAVFNGLKRPAAPADSSALPIAHKIVLDMRATGGFVSGRTFDPAMYPRTLVLGDTEKWSIKAEREPHPFHIHVNPFQVVDDTEGGPSVWQDTLLVPSGKTATLVTRYTDFVGKFVLHCHNLVHEDRGMMELVEIVPQPTGTLGQMEYFRWTPDKPPPADWSFLDRTGNRVTRADFLHRVALLHLWTLECSNCTDELKQLAILKGELDATRFDVAVVALGASPQATEAFLAAHGLSALSPYADPTKELGTVFETQTLPTAILVDRAGHSRARIKGRVNWNAQEVVQVLRYFMEN